MIFIKIAGISIITTIWTLMSFYYFMPFQVDKIYTEEHMLGATVTEIAGGDKMSGFPTTYNANLNALNNNKVEMSTTSMSNLTTLANLTTVGTIGTGVWNGTGLTVAYGGTGSSTLLANSILVGNGTGAITSIASGTEGYTLKMVNGSPAWASQSVDESGDYTWTGNHVFSSYATFSGNAGLGTATATQITLDEEGDSDSEVVTKGYVDDYQPLNFLVSGFSSTSPLTVVNYDQTGTTSISTSGRRARGVEFVVYLVEHFQTGGNSTRYRMYQVYLDLVNQTRLVQTLTSSDSANLENCTFQANVGIESITANPGAFTGFNTGGSNIVYLLEVLSDEDSIDFGYRLQSDAGGSEGCIAVGGIKIYE